MDEEHYNTQFTTSLFSKKLWARKLYIRFCFVEAHPFQAHLLVKEPFMNQSNPRMPLPPTLSPGIPQAFDGRITPNGGEFDVNRYPPGREGGGGEGHLTMIIKTLMSIGNKLKDYVENAKATRLR